MSRPTQRTFEKDLENFRRAQEAFENPSDLDVAYENWEKRLTQPYFAAALRLARTVDKMVPKNEKA